MNTEEIKDKNVVIDEVTTDSGEDKKPFKKWEKSRFEFALFVNDFLICKRSFLLNGFIEKSMQSMEFKDELDKMVELINNDLVSKSRVYTWYHLPEFKFDEGTVLMSDWEPEVMTDPLIPEGECTFKFVVLDNGVEVVSRVWDGRYLPTYVRKNVDLTNRQIKVTRGEKTYTYDKERFFEEHDQLFGELYVLKAMINDKPDLVPVIQNMISEVCSSLDGYYEKISDYHTTVRYDNHDIKRDKDGNGIYELKTFVDADGVKHGMADAFGNPWMIPVLDAKKTKGKEYCLNIEAYNKKIDSAWGAAVADKTKKHMAELYYQPKEKFRKKNTEE